MNIEPIKSILPNADYKDPGKFDDKMENEQVIDYLDGDVAVYPRMLSKTASRFKILMNIRRAGFECTKIGYKFCYFYFKERTQ